MTEKAEAAALIELRRDLLWTRENGKRVSQILHALTHRPEGLLRNERAYLMIRVAMRRLELGRVEAVDDQRQRRHRKVLRQRRFAIPLRHRP